MAEQYYIYHHEENKKPKKKRKSKTQWVTVLPPKEGFFTEGFSEYLKNKIDNNQ